MLNKVASLEGKVTKWRDIAHTVMRVECPKVANATITFVEAVKSNHQLSSKVGSVLGKLQCTRVNGDELFERCKDLQKKKKDLLAGWRRASLPRWWWTSRLG